MLEFLKSDQEVGDAGLISNDSRQDDVHTFKLIFPLACVIPSTPFNSVFLLPHPHLSSLWLQESQQYERVIFTEML